MSARALVAALALSVVACSSTTAEPQPAGDAAAGDGASPSADATPDAPAPFDSAVVHPCAPAASDQDCPALGAGCAACCACLHPHGVQVYNAALVACACAPERCLDACRTSLCATPASDPSPGGACDACVRAALEQDAGGSCSDPVSTACRADADCAALLACMHGSNACP